MASTKISAMPAASALTGAEVVPGVQSGGNVKITLGTAAGVNTGTTVGTLPVINAAGGLTLSTISLTNTNAIVVFASPDNVYAAVMPAFGTRTDVSGQLALLTVGGNSPTFTSFAWAPNAANTAIYAGSLVAMELNAGGSNSGGTLYGQVVLFKETSPTGVTARKTYMSGTGVYTSFTETFSVDSAGNAVFSGLIQNGGTQRVTGDVTNATTTFANVTGVSETLVAGQKYVGELTVFASDSTAVDGLKFDFNGGTATATSFVAGLVGTPIGATVGTAYSTALATALTATTATTGDIAYNISFEIVVNAGGTFIPRFAQNAHTTGTATLRLGSNMVLRKCSN